MRLQKEVARVEDVSLHSGKIHKPRLNLCNVEEGIVATPKKHRSGLILRQIVSHLPEPVDISGVVGHERLLQIKSSRQTHDPPVFNPTTWIDLRRDLRWQPGDVLVTGPLEGQMGGGGLLVPSPTFSTGVVERRF
jgi:hypothetical protein